MTLLRILGLFVLFLITGVSCKDDDSLHPTPSPGAAGQASGPEITATLELTPGKLSIAAGTSSNVQATRVSSDGTTADVTSDATWTSSAPEVASVEGGTVAGLKVGTADITVTASNLTATLTVTVTDATLVTLSITPPSPTLALGLARQLKATGVFTDGTTQDLTKQVTWSSATKKVATVSREGLLTASAVGSTKISAKLGATSATTVVTVSPAVVASIALTPPGPTIPKGVTRQLTATATLSDGSTEDVTNQADWVSSDESVATVDQSSGLLSAIAAGEATLSATVAGVTGSTKVTITSANLVSLGVTPATPSLAKGLNQQFTAMGTFSDNTVFDLTSQVTWALSDDSVATISNAAGSRGLATTTGVGSTTVSATHDGITASTTLTVTAATLVSIGVTPATPSIAKGLSQQFTAVGTYTDATTQDLTATATWTSSDTDKATVSNAAGSQGLLSTSTVGTTSVSAALDGVTGSTTVTVSPATLVSIGVTPATPSIAKGLSKQFTAIGTYTDATTQDLTATATWASSDTDTATVSNAAGSRGLASGADVGSTSISATFEFIVGSTTLTVTAATLVSIDVTPATPSLAKGLSQQFTATGTYTDTTTQDLTAVATWVSSDTDKATVSNAAGSQGLVSSADLGTTSISATFEDVTGSTTLTVTPATLVSIGITPANPSIAKGLKQQFTATGIYTDATTQDLTATSTWASSDEDTATISNAAGSQGFASSADVGTASISATFDGVMGSTTLTVTAATLVSIVVTPATPSIAKGLTQQFTATGSYTDTSTQDLTTTATWASSDEDKATISNAAGSQGLASSEDIGPTSISAKFEGITGSTTLTVTAATLVSIAVTPETPTVAKGLSQQFTAVGTYTDTSTQILTTTATWASSDTDKASISNAAGSKGLASTEDVGPTSISATFGGVTGSTTLTVSPATLVSIAVTPANSGILTEATQQYAAIGTYSDGSTQDLTTGVTWGSSNAAAATISNATGSKGLATGGDTLGLSTVISATLGATVGTTNLYISRHDIMSWTGFSTATNSCSMLGSTGFPLGNFEWLSIPNLTWKACLLQATMRGAQVLSPSYGPWPLPGWFASRAPGSNQVMIGSWPTYISDNLNNTRPCNLVRDRQSGATNDSPLANVITYDGDTWKYQDFGPMYIDQCEKLASAAGASIITPWTIGLPNGDNYWIGVLHLCSGYGWTLSNGTALGSESAVGRVSQKGCMLGYIL